MIFGEVLFDLFPGDMEILGGAPLNVAWHLQGLGLSPVMISRVGRDERGDRILERMTRWGLTTEGIQIDPVHGTGEVRVSFSGDEPRFEVTADRAYDFIEADPMMSLMQQRPALLYHGTLALRGPVSRRTLLACCTEKNIPTFIDINLRDPWWDEVDLKTYLNRATWIKLNDDELKQISILVGDLNYLLRNPDADMVIVTQGKNGATLLVRDRPLLQQSAPIPDPLVDTVGAGDAFSAVTIAGILGKWPVELILTRALQFAAKVCAIRGATPADRSFYESTLEQWEREG